MCGEGTGARPEGGPGWGGEQGSGKNGRAALALAFMVLIGDVARLLAEEILEPFLNLNSGWQRAVGEFMAESPAVCRAVHAGCEGSVLPRRRLKGRSLGGIC